MSKAKDQELFAAGRRARSKGGCRSVIVATDPEGIRNYHNCNGPVGHGFKGERHGCGCGQEWWATGTKGPLTDVVRAGETIV